MDQQAKLQSFTDVELLCIQEQIAMNVDASDEADLLRALRDLNLIERELLRRGFSQQQAAHESSTESTPQLQSQAA